jgi:ribosomal protein S1
MPSLEVIKDILLFIGVPFTVITVALIVALLLYSKAKVIISDILRLFGSIHKWVRRKSVETEIEGSINSFTSNFNSEISAQLFPTCNVQWVTDANQQCVIEQGKVIIRMSFSGNSHNLNFYNATYSFIQTALLYRTKPFLNKITAKAIDLLMTKILLLQSHRPALSVFNDRFKLESEDCKDIYFRLEETDERGLFKRILLQEYYFFGESLGEKTPKESHEKEAEEFLEWFYELATREHEEKTTLTFETEHIKIGIILVASDETYKKFGKEPYLRRANIYAANNYQVFYILSRGQSKGQIAKDIARDLVATGSFENLTKKPDIIRKRLHGESPLFITCIALRPDLTTIVQQAWEHLQSAFNQQRQILVVIQRVQKDSIIVNAYGLIIPISNQNLSSMQIPDAAKFFEPEQELSVNISEFDQKNEMVVLCNINTKTDPQRLIETLEHSKETPIESEVKEIIVSEGYETGVLIKIGNKEIEGYIPRSKATYSRFISLSEKYPIGSKLKVVPIGYLADYGNHLCSVFRLQNPWLTDKDYSIGKVVKATIRQISERYITCELKEGLEGKVPAEELSWASIEENLSRIKNFKVSDILDVRIINVNPVRKSITLSVKRLNQSPTEAYFTRYRDRIIDATVKQISPNAATVILDDSVIEGYLHIGEVIWGYCTGIENYLKQGERVQVKVLDYNPVYDKIIVSAKRCVKNNFLEFSNRHKVGDVVNASLKFIQKDRAQIQIDFNDNLSVQGYVHKSELSNLLYIDEDVIKNILKPEYIYPMVVKRINYNLEIVELSQKQYFDRNISQLEYGREYEVLQIQRIKNHIYIRAQDFEALLNPNDSKDVDITKSKVIIARIDVNRKMIEVKFV